MGPGRPRRKTSDKRNVLGAFLEAPRRQNLFSGPETGELQNFLKIYKKNEKQMKNYEQCLLKWMSIQLGFLHVVMEV